MIPGEIITADGDIELNAGLARTTLAVSNTGDRPIQVGCHYHFAETNPALSSTARGPRPAARHSRRHRGALRAWPDREVQLVAFAASAGLGFPAPSWARSL